MMIMAILSRSAETFHSGIDQSSRRKLKNSVQMTDCRNDETATGDHSDVR